LVAKVFSLPFFRFEIFQFYFATGFDGLYIKTKSKLTGWRGIEMAKFKEAKLFVIFLIALVCLTGLFLEKSSADETKNEIISEWLDRVEISAQYETNQKPRLYFQTVQPLYQNNDKDNTVFIQPRVSLQEGDATYNLGTGYRRLVSENLLLGINVFGDYAAEHDHGRAGIGLEALGQVLEARINSYIGITGQREVAQAVGSTTYERIANGVDYELGAPIPYLPWLKVYGSGFWYDYNNFTDRKGWKSRVEAKLSKSLRLEFYTFDDNKGEQEYGGRLRFNVAFNNLSDIFNAFKISDEPFPKKDLREEMLIPVERHHEIVVERFIRSGGLTIEAGRI
jgi:adhesin/invasin